MICFGPLQRVLLAHDARTCVGHSVQLLAAAAAALYHVIQASEATRDVSTRHVQRLSRDLRLRCYRMRSLLLPTLLAINRSSSIVLHSCCRTNPPRTQHWQRFCAMSTTSEHSSDKSSTKVLGVIGGIASGKSTVAKVLSE
jgi:hypothetical protein